jgi:ATP-dependent Clp protease protease subunit
MRNLMSSKNSSGVWFSISAVAIGLVMLIASPPGFAGQQIKKSGPHFAVADTSKVTTPTDSHTKAEVGINEWFDQERVIFLTGEINPELAELVISRLLYLDRKAPGKAIYLYINSPGGDVTAGLAIYDAIRSLQSDIVTVGLGEASSMASILLASGTKGKRVASPHTRIMIHQPWSGVIGQASDIAIRAKEILYLRSVLNGLLSQLTGQPLKRIEVDTDRDFYMSAQEAKAYGIVDQTINQLPSATRPLK